MKNKKIIISLIILVLGIGLISYGLFTYWDSLKNNKGGGTNDSSSQYNNQIPIIKSNRIFVPITNYSKEKDSEKELLVSDFTINNEKKNSIAISFNLINNTENSIKEKVLYLNCYNDKKLIEAHEFSIGGLETNDEMGFETIIELEDQKITKYEFEIDNYKTDIKPVKD